MGLPKPSTVTRATLRIWPALVLVTTLPSCAPQPANLLTTEAISFSYRTLREQRMLDGRIPAPESPVDDFVAALLLSSQAQVTFDLGRTRRVAAIQLVAIGDELVVEHSSNGTLFEPLDLLPAGAAPPMEIRAASGLDLSCRFLRIRVRPGGTSAAVGELLALEETPARFPAPLGVQSPADFDTTVARLLSRRAWVRRASALLALIAVALVAAVRNTARRRRLAWVACGIAGFAWLGLGTLHGDGRLLHPWELTHYYLGSKYFSELRYTGLYRCLAEHERAQGRGRMLDTAAIRDLTTNEMRPGSWTRTPEGHCQAQLSPARSAAFAQDADRLRRLFVLRHFQRVLGDHGYNATPLQTLLLGSLTSRLAPTRASLGALSILDILLVALSVGAIAGAFGPLAGAAAATILAVGPPWDFSWTGGSLGRYLWLAALCGGLALLRRERLGWGGFLLATSGLLRLFPLVLLAGPAIRVVVGLIRGEMRREDRRLWAGVAAAMLIGVALPAASFGPRVYHEFYDNIRIHGALPPGNHLGLGVLCSAGVSQSVVQAGAGPAWGTTVRRGIWAGGIAAALGLLAAAARRNRPPWELVSLSGVLLFSSLPLSGYDYVWLLILAPLVVASQPTRAVCLAALAVAAFVPDATADIRSQYLLTSAAVLVTLAAVAWWEATRQVPEPVDRL